MTTIAYIANEFPCPLEPYVVDEIKELRRRGVQVVCCSGKRVSQNGLSLAERAFWKETRYFQPLSDDELMRALGRLASNRRNLWQLLRPLVWERGTSGARRIRALGGADSPGSDGYLDALGRHVRHRHVGIGLLPERDG